MTRSSVKLALLAVTLAPIAAFAAPATYNIAGLPTPVGGSSIANSISAAGVVGNVSDSEGNSTEVLWTSGGIVELLPFDVLSSVGAAKSNNNGLVVGGGFGFRQPPRGVSWQNGVGTFLAVDDGDEDETDFLFGSTALGVNDAGVIVGQAETEWGTVGVVWQTNGDIDLLLGVNPSGPHYAGARDINASGVVAGIATIDDVRHAVTWTNGVIKDLGIFAGGDLSSANAVNDVGQVVGWGATSQDTGVAFISDGNTLTPLPNLPGMAYGEAFDINNAGLAVGACLPPGIGEGVATLWMDGLAYDLNSLLPAGSGWQLLSATGISEDGTIVGFGIYNGQTLAYSMSVVPEPAVLGSLLVAGALLRRRR